WYIGFGICIYLGVKLANSFKENTFEEERRVIVQPKKDILYLDVMSSSVTINDLNFISINNRKLNYGKISLNIIPSETDSFELIQINSARGESIKAASSRARGIRY